MLLSEMFEVERDVDFEVIGYIGRFVLREQSDGTERLWWRLKDNNVYVNADLDILYDVIRKAPSGIIHLPPPLTDEQREQLKAIWTLGGRWLAKDANRDVYAYSVKPEQNSDWAEWVPIKYDEDELQFTVYRDLDVCDLVSWSDAEPYDIGKALEIKR
jgi:hypothetical protein